MAQGKAREIFDSVIKIKSNLASEAEDISKVMDQELAKESPEKSKDQVQTLIQEMKTQKKQLVSKFDRIKSMQKTLTLANQEGDNSLQSLNLEQTQKEIDASI